MLRLAGKITITMEALKVWSSRPLRHLFHVASSSSSLLPPSKSSTFIRCCSSSSSAAGAAATTTAAVPKQAGRGRRSPAAPNTTSTSDRDAIRAIRLKKFEFLIELMDC
ncbi:hypothetical protein Hanom_Chr13g01239111 [Helianthus anomalus]